MRGPGIVDSLAYGEMAALLQLAARYWARADSDLSIVLDGIFTADATLQLGSLELQGLPEIERFFRERDVMQREAQRTTRHIACNHQLNALATDRIEVRSTVLVYVGTGPWPMQSATPSAIADFIDICVRIPAGPWRFARREGRTVFVGPGAATFAK
jgi:hypothetical protein